MRGGTDDCVYCIPYSARRVVMFTSTTSLKFTVPRSGPITVNAWSDQALTVIGPNLGNGKFLSEFVVW